MILDSQEHTRFFRAATEDEPVEGLASERTDAYAIFPSDSEPAEDGACAGLMEWCEAADGPGWLLERQGESFTLVHGRDITSASWLVDLASLLPLVSEEPVAGVMMSGDACLVYLGSQSAVAVRVVDAHRVGSVLKDLGQRFQR